MIVYTISTCHTLERRLKNGERKTDRMEKHPNILATHEKSENNASIKKKTARLVCI